MFNITKIKEDLPTALIVERAFTKESPVHEAGTILLETTQSIIDKYSEDECQVWLVHTYLDLCESYRRAEQVKDKNKATMFIYKWLSIQIEWLNSWWA